MKKLVTVTTLFFPIFVFGALVFSYSKSSISQETQSEVAKQTKALVDEAAALVESQGKDAFTNFRKKDSRWFSGDTYIFVIDMKGVELFHPIQPELEGKSIIDMKDSNGEAFIQEMIDIANTKGSGWVEYMWPKPGETEPSKKMTYIKKVKSGEDSLIVGSGYYPD